MKYFTVCGGWNSATCKWNKQTRFLKEVIWKTSQNSQIDTRSSHSKVFLSKGVLKNVAKFTDKHLYWSLLFIKVAGWKLRQPLEMFCKSYRYFWKGTLVFPNQPFIDPLWNRCYWIIDKLHRKKPVLESFRELFRGPATLLKKTSTQVLPCEIWKLLEFTNFQKNYFEENLGMSAPKVYLKRDSNTWVFPWILLIIQEHLLCRGSPNGWFWNSKAVASL